MIMAIPAGKPVVAVVIPCYRVTAHVLDLIAHIGPEVDLIVAVDDACPDGSGRLILERNRDGRVDVVFHDANQGVGGAVMTGYQRAIDAGATVIVKLDGDGQMDPALVPRFIRPILAGEADYVKGNRFYDLRQIHQMPGMRLFGNAVLSFMAKFSSGYWNIFDPTNGYTAINARVAAVLPFERISKRYFFETDLLFRLGTYRALVQDVPMNAKYGDEVSNLRIGKILGEFLGKHARNLAKRIFYNYFLRDMSIASVELLAGSLLLGFGCFFGAYHWIRSLEQNTQTPVGIIMFSVLPIIVGLQLLLAFLAFDIANQPRRTVSENMPEL